MPSERVTVILSKAGWVRCAKGDNIDPKGLSYKPEDKPYLATSGNSNIKLISLLNLAKHIRCMLISFHQLEAMVSI